LANRQKEIYAWAQTRKVAPGPTTQPPDVTIVPHHHFVHGNSQVAVKYRFQLLHGISSKNTEECKNIDLIMISGTNYNWLDSSAATLLSIKIEKCKKTILCT
jgi:hypothetical protein